MSHRDIPRRGVYIFLDPNEPNFVDGAPRIVRVGTHAVSAGSKSTLRNRLRQHLGVGDGGGNHRGSIFRLHVGRAMLERDGLSKSLKTWGDGQNAPVNIREREAKHEVRVSTYLRALEVCLLDIDDEPSKESLRASVETQLIGLCSQGLHPIDETSAGWLGRFSPMNLISNSGLWNLRDVGSDYVATGRGSVADIESKGLMDGHS